MCCSPLIPTDVFRARTGRAVASRLPSSTWLAALVVALVACGACSAPAQRPTTPTTPTAAQGANAPGTSNKKAASKLKPATTAANREARARAAAKIKTLGRNASRLHTAMVREKTPKRCEALRGQRDLAAGTYAQALIGRLEDQLSAATARQVFAQAAGISRARWVQPAEQHRAQALLRRAGVLLWQTGRPQRQPQAKLGKRPPAAPGGSIADTPGARLKRVQDAGAWVLQLPPGDPTVRAWRQESSRLAAHHATLRAERLASPFAAALQNKLVRELGGTSHPTARRWITAVVRASSLRFDITAKGRCPDSAARIRAALASPFGVRVPLHLDLTACGPQTAGAAAGVMRVLVGTGTLTPQGGAAIAVPLALGAKPPAAPGASDKAATLTAAAIDAQLCGAAATRLRAGAVPVRERLAAAEVTSARTATDLLKAEEHWLKALAWAGKLPADGAAFLAKNLALTVAQARAAQSLRWTRPRLLLRMPTRPYPMGKPHVCKVK